MARYTKTQFADIASGRTELQLQFEQTSIVRNGVHHIAYTFDLDATELGGRMSHVVMYFGTDEWGVQNDTIIAEIDSRETITLNAKSTYLGYSGIYRLIYEAVFCKIEA